MNSRIISRIIEIEPPEEEILPHYAFKAIQSIQIIEDVQLSRFVIRIITLEFKPMLGDVAGLYVIGKKDEEIICVNFLMIAMKDAMCDGDSLSFFPYWYDKVKDREDIEINEQSMTEAACMLDLETINNLITSSQSIKSMQELINC